MNTYHITQSLLNNVARTNAIIALNNSSSTPAPTWFVWTVAIVTVAIIAVGAIVLYDICKDDIEYFFWDLKHRKK